MKELAWAAAETRVCARIAREKSPAALQAESGERASPLRAKTLDKSLHRTQNQCPSVSQPASQPASQALIIATRRGWDNRTICEILICTDRKRREGKRRDYSSVFMDSDDYSM